MLARPLLVTSLPSIRYLTGFTGSNAALIVDPGGDDRFATDGRYRDQAAEQVPDLGALVERGTVLALAGSWRGPLDAETGIDAGTAGALRVERPDLALVDGAVEALRATKDADEINRLERACAITAEAVDMLWREVRPGMTEVAIARRLEQLFGDLGAEDRAFPSIVALGEHSAIPHHDPGPREARVGDLLLVDAGARVDGYHADMTRVAVIGSEPADWQAELHAIVDAAASAGRAALRGGARCREVDGSARAVIEAAGHGADFTHGLGHGTGLEIHEAPMMGPRATGSIPAFASVTVEPGVYLPGRGGIRIEDSLLVGANGARVMTQAPRALLPTG